MTARDYSSLRASIQPGLAHGLEKILRGRTKGLDHQRLIDLSRDYFEEPHTFDELRDHLAGAYPKADIRALAYTVRLQLPLVQVPGETPWGYAANCAFTLAETWLRKKVDPKAATESLAERYLAVYGPATPADFAAWSGMSGPMARDAFDKLRPKLITLQAERKRELFDLPKAPRPSEDVEAPVRFLPEFDNLILSHADRRRFIAEAHRRAIYLPGLRVAPTFLVDGFVAGTWKVERKKDLAILSIIPFEKTPKAAREELEEEGGAVARFIERDAARVDVRFDSA